MIVKKLRAYAHSKMNRLKVRRRRRRRIKEKRRNVVVKRTSKRVFSLSCVTQFSYLLGVSF